MRNPLSTLLLLALSPLLAATAVAAQGAAAAPDAAPTGGAEVAPEPAPTVMVRLRSGDILWGAIAGHDPDRVHVRRLETGGLVKLPWAFLDPDEEAALRLRFGYVDAVSEELMMTADRIQLDNGREILGLIERRTDDYLFVKRADSTVPVAKRLVTGATSVQVPALDIYTKDELYQRMFLELSSRLILPGLEGAEAHRSLAQFAERLFDYRHAAHHYEQVQKLAPELEPDVIGAALARSQAKAALQEQVDFLADIDLRRARKQYGRALEGLAAFPELYPGSPLLEDWNKLRDRVARYQERDLREQVVQRWHYWTGELALRALRKLETLEEVLAYTEEAYATDLMDAVQSDLQRIAPGIEPDDILRLWKEREAGRYRQATYSIGTWLLGDERARAGLEEEEAQTEAPAEGTAAAERKKLEKRLERYFQNQKVSRKSGDEEEGESPEDFWKRWRGANRAQWLRAYFVENSGLFELSRVRFANCRECGGTGARLVTYSGSAISGDTASDHLIPCPTCHAVGVTRRLRYR